MVVSIVIGVLFGRVEAVAWAYLIGSIIATIPCIAIPGRLIGMRVRDVWFSVRGSFLCAAIMAVIVWSVSQILPGGLKPLYQLAILVASGLGVYALIVWWFATSAYREIIDVAGRIVPKASAQTAPLV
jgi:hypothetical protein